MNNLIDMFFYLLRLGLGTEKVGGLVPVGFSSLNEEQTGAAWGRIFKLGVGQGVAAIQFDGVQCLLAEEAQKVAGEPEAAMTGMGKTLPQPPKRLMLSWFAHAVQIEGQCAAQLETAAELAAIYGDAGIRTVVLKGIAAGLNYPQPEHRPCGDLDCFLMGEYERGNALAAKAGAEVIPEHYKHSHITYRGLTVENHQFCAPVRGSRRIKAFERLLRSLLREEGTEMIGETRLECPSPMFNALFLTNHAKTHFFSEGIVLRHLCDWAMLLHRHGEDIDWPRFKEYCREFGMGNFADSMTRLSARLLNVAVPVGYAVEENREQDDYLLDEMLSGMSRLSGGSVWMQRLGIIRNVANNRKRHKVFSDKTYLHYICQLVFGFIFDRTPKL